eukprot:956526_1
MRNTRFYATEEVIDTGHGRIYKVGDKGVAEHCDIFCQRMGRGHTHLEYCKGQKNHDMQLQNPQIRHQTQSYQPDPEKEKDEITHKKYWSLKKWDDPCAFNKLLSFSFDKCPYICSHPSHQKKKKFNEQKQSNDDSKNEDEDIQYCKLPLWHDICDPKGCTCGKCHKFDCTTKHKYSHAHVIFVGDCSGSMTTSDTKPTLNWIINHSTGTKYGLNNRLGALYEA